MLIYLCCVTFLPVFITLLAMVVAWAILGVDSGGIQSNSRVHRWLCRFRNKWYRIWPIKILMSDCDEIFQRGAHRVPLILSRLGANNRNLHESLWNEHLIKYTSTRFFYRQYENTLHSMREELKTIK